MNRTLELFISELQNTSKDIAKTLQKGAKANEIASLEKEFGVEFTKEVIDFYATINGQDPESEYTYFEGQVFVALDEVFAVQQNFKEILQQILPDYENFRYEEEDVAGVIKNKAFNDKWLPIMASDNDYTFVDFDPAESGEIGQVARITIYDDGGVSLDFLAFDLKEFFEDEIECLKEKSYIFNEEEKTIVDDILNFYDFDENDFEEREAPESSYTSKGGSAVYNYEASDEGFVPADTACVYMDEICEHFEKYFGKSESVFHEILSEYVHIDVHWIKPTPEKPYHLLYTTGMSDKPMYLPKEWSKEEKKAFSHAELMVFLPEDWKISDEDFKEDENYWPVYFLKMLARFPHQYKTFLAFGHTIPNGPDAEPIANTNFGCMLVLPAMISAPEDFHRLTTKDGTEINFYALIPIYKEEMEYKLEEGTDALLDHFDDEVMTEVIDINRPCMV